MAHGEFAWADINYGTRRLIQEVIRGMLIL